MLQYGQINLKFVKKKGGGEFKLNSISNLFHNFFKRCRLLYEYTK